MNWVTKTASITAALTGFGGLSFYAGRLNERSDLDRRSYTAEYVSQRFPLLSDSKEAILEAIENRKNASYDGKKGGSVFYDLCKNIIEGKAELIDLVSYYRDDELSLDNAARHSDGRDPGISSSVDSEIAFRVTSYFSAQALRAERLDYLKEIGREPEGGEQSKYSSHYVRCIAAQIGIIESVTVRVR